MALNLLFVGLSDFEMEHLIILNPSTNRSFLLLVLQELGQPLPLLILFQLNLALVISSSLNSFLSSGRLNGNIRWQNALRYRVASLCVG